MIPSIIDGLNKRDVEAVMNTYTLTDFVYPTLFPLEFSTSLTWESLEGTEGSPVVADVVSYDSTAPRKRREIVGKAYGDIPKIAIAREKTEKEMNKYNELRRYADSSAKQALLSWIWDDQAFCYKGVNARLEYNALRAASTGKLSLDATNNDGGIVTETAVDFKIPSGNKSGVSVAITVANAATSKPITKIKAIVASAKSAGVKLQYIFTDQAMIDGILASAETLSYVAPWVMQATQLTQTPNLQSLNTALRGLNLPQIILIDSYVTIEIKGNRTQVAAWEAGVMLFSDTATIGSTKYAPLADEFIDSTNSIKVKRGHVLIKRFANEEPLRETCLAMANAMPVISGTKTKYLVDGLNSAWNK
jgi:Phage major capsid protein E